MHRLDRKFHPHPHRPDILAFLSLVTPLNSDFQQCISYSSDGPFSSLKIERYEIFSSFLSFPHKDVESLYHPELDLLSEPVTEGGFTIEFAFL